jgi:hypothetical protein
MYGYYPTPSDVGVAVGNTRVTGGSKKTPRNRQTHPLCRDLNAHAAFEWPIWPLGEMLVFAIWHAICLPMPIRLHCDAPGCQGSTSVPLLPGTYRHDLRLTDGWWIIAGDAGTTTACCTAHLNAALAKQAQRPHPVIVCDEAAYA